MAPRSARIAAVLERHGIQSPELVAELAAAVDDPEPAPAPQGPPGTTDAVVVSGYPLSWNTRAGTFQYAGVPAVLMWVDSTLAGLWSGMRQMVGDRRFALALQHQGRDSVADDWNVIATGDTFEGGFAALAEVAASAGWGRWTLEALDREAGTLEVRASGSWEALLAVHTGAFSGMNFLAGKFAGYGARLFGHNCWTDVERVSGGDPTAYRFRVGPSARSLETELDQLLASDEATRADLAVAVRQLRTALEERERIAAELLVEKQRAEAATKAKSRFLATMSHELRTPLHGILGSMEILADAALPDTEQELARGALDAARSLLGIVGDLLDISKIEANELVLDEAPFDLARVLRETVDLMAPTAQRRGLRLSVHLPVGFTGQRTGDAGRVRQVVVNLVSNALKFTTEGAVEVHGEVLGPARVRIRVSDTGIGIPADRIDRIFDAFHQLDSSSTRRYSGTGLGLAICSSLAEMMGGTLTVQSTEGQGSTFLFDVPLAPVEAPRPVEGPAELPETFSGRVLVVDDVEVNRQIAVLQLEGLGCTTVEATDGLEALDRLAQHDDLDLVLMDVMMPRLDGLAATRVFRARSSAPLPIIALTANAMLGDREECLAAGMDDYLPKPVQKDALVRCLARWLA